MPATPSCSVRAVSVAMLLAALSGCASLSENECRSADWRGIGLQDGLQGKALSELERHRRACADYAISVAERPYLDGRDEGLRDYCRLDNAFRVGLNGQQYQGVCPPALDLDFRRYNDTAYGVYKLKKDIAGLDSQIDAKERRLRDKDLGDKEKLRLYDELRDLDRRRDRQRDDLAYQERALDRMMDELRRHPGR